MWQCSKWTKGVSFSLVSALLHFVYYEKAAHLPMAQEDPESSDVWQDLGACDPDVQHSQSVLTKRASTIEARDAGETSNCLGYVQWTKDATFRSGSTVSYGTSCFVESVHMRESLLINWCMLGGHLWQTKHWVVHVSLSPPKPIAAQ